MKNSFDPSIPYSFSKSQGAMGNSFDPFAKPKANSFDPFAKNSGFDPFSSSTDVTEEEPEETDAQFRARMDKLRKAMREEKKDFFRADDSISAIWDAVKGLGVTAPAAFYQLSEGLNRPDQYSSSAKKAFAEADAFSRAMQDKTTAKKKAGKSSSVGESIREAGGSLGFSLGSMAAAIPSSIAGAKVGGRIGAGIAAVAGVAGPQAAIPEEFVTLPAGYALGSLIGGATAAMTASGTAAYRMAGAQFLNEAFENLNAESQRKNKRPMNEAEMKSAYENLLPIAKNTALWEAGPEAVSSAVTLGAGKIIFGLGKPLASKFAKSLVGKVAIGAGSLATELGTETLTQVEQAADQKKAMAIAEGKDPSAIKADWTAGGVVDAFKQVAPQTLALMGLIGGAGGAIKIAASSLPSKPKPAPAAPSAAAAAARRAAMTTALLGTPPAAPAKPAKPALSPTARAASLVQADPQQAAARLRLLTGLTTPTPDEAAERDVLRRLIAPAAPTPPVAPASQVPTPGATAAPPVTPKVQKPVDVGSTPPPAATPAPGVSNPAAADPFIAPPTPVPLVKPTTTGELRLRVKKANATLERINRDVPGMKPTADLDKVRTELAAGTIDESTVARLEQAVAEQDRSSVAIAQTRALEREKQSNERARIAAEKARAAQEKKNAAEVDKLAKAIAREQKAAFRKDPAAVVAELQAERDLAASAGADVRELDARIAEFTAKLPKPKIPKPEKVAEDVGTAIAVADKARDDAVIDVATPPSAVVEGEVGPFEFGEIDNGSLFPLAGVIKALRAKEGLDIDQVTKGFEEGLRKLVDSTPTLSDESNNSRTRLAIAWLLPNGTVVQTGLLPNSKKVVTRTLGGSFSDGMLVQRMAGGGPRSKVKPFEVGGTNPILLSEMLKVATPVNVVSFSGEPGFPFQQFPSFAAYEATLAASEAARKGKSTKKVDGGEDRYNAGGAGIKGGESGPANVDAVQAAEMRGEAATEAGSADDAALNWITDDKNRFSLFNRLSVSNGRMADVRKRLESSNAPAAERVLEWLNDVTAGVENADLAIERMYKNSQNAEAFAEAGRDPAAWTAMQADDQSEAAPAPAPALAAPAELLPINATAPTTPTTPTTPTATASVTPTEVTPTEVTPTVVEPAPAELPTPTPPAPAPTPAALALEAALQAAEAREPVAAPTVSPAASEELWKRLGDADYDITKAWAKMLGSKSAKVQAMVQEFTAAGIGEKEIDAALEVAANVPEPKVKKEKGESAADFTERFNQRLVDKQAVRFIKTLSERAPVETAATQEAVSEPTEVTPAEEEIAEVTEEEITEEITEEEPTQVSEESIATLWSIMADADYDVITALAKMQGSKKKAIKAIVQEFTAADIGEQEIAAALEVAANVPEPKVKKKKGESADDFTERFNQLLVDKQRAAFTKVLRGEGQAREDRRSLAQVQEISSQSVGAILEVKRDRFGWHLDDDIRADYPSDLVQWDASTLDGEGKIRDGTPVSEDGSELDATTRVYKHDGIYYLRKALERGDGDGTLRMVDTVLGSKLSAGQIREILTKERMSLSMDRQTGFTRGPSIGNYREENGAEEQGDPVASLWTQLATSDLAFTDPVKPEGRELNSILNQFGVPPAITRGKNRYIFDPTTELVAGDEVQVLGSNGDLMSTPGTRFVSRSDNSITVENENAAERGVDQFEVFPVDRVIPGTDVIQVKQVRKGEFVIDSVYGGSIAERAYQGIYAWASANKLRIVEDSSTTAAGEMRRTAHAITAGLRLGTLDFWGPLEKSRPQLKQMGVSSMAEWNALPFNQKIGKLLVWESKRVRMDLQREGAWPNLTLDVESRRAYDISTPSNPVPITDEQARARIMEASLAHARTTGERDGKPRVGRGDVKIGPRSIVRALATLSRVEGNENGRGDVGLDDNALVEDLAKWMRGLISESGERGPLYREVVRTSAEQAERTNRTQRIIERLRPFVDVTRVARIIGNDRAVGASISPEQVIIAMDDVAFHGNKGLVTLLHEAQHSLFDGLPEATKAKIRRAVQRSIEDFRTKATAASKRTGVRVAANIGANVDEALVESTAQQLAAEGIAEPQSMAAALWRMVKDIYLLATRALLEGLGAPQERIDAIALAWWENSMRRTLGGDFDSTFIRLMDRFTPATSLQRAAAMENDSVDPIAGELEAAFREQALRDRVRVMDLLNAAFRGVGKKGAAFTTDQKGLVSVKGLLRSLQKWLPADVYDFVLNQEPMKFLLDPRLTSVDAKKFVDAVARSLPQTEIKKLVPKTLMSPKVADLTRKIESLGYKVMTEHTGDNIHKGDVMLHYIDSVAYNKGFSLLYKPDGRVGVRKAGGGWELFTPPKNRSLANSGEFDADLDAAYGEVERLAKNLQIAVRDPVNKAASNSAATGKYGIEPIKVQEMNNPVDVLVREPIPAPAEGFSYVQSPSGKWSILDQYGQPYPYEASKSESEFDDEKTARAYAESLERNSERGIRYSHTHFGAPNEGGEDFNVIASVRGYEVGDSFFAFEVQSDWGQALSKQTAERDAIAKQGKVVQHDSGKYAVMNNGSYLDEDGAEVKLTLGEPMLFDKWEQAESFRKVWVRSTIVNLPGKTVAAHPLAARYESIGIKSAILHALEQGKTALVLPDPETAMMIEGHDYGIATPEFFNETIGKHLDEKYGDYVNPLKPGEVILEQGGELTEANMRKMIDAGIEVLFTKESGRISLPLRDSLTQGAGMRQAYGRTYHDIAEKLTGSRGRRVELGKFTNRGPSTYFGGKDTITGYEYDLTAMSPDSPNLEWRYRESAPELDLGGNEAWDRVQGAVFNEVAPLFAAMKKAIAPEMPGEKFWTLLGIGEDPEVSLKKIEAKTPGSSSARINGEGMTKAMSERASALALQTMLGAQKKLAKKLNASIEKINTASDEFLDQREAVAKTDAEYRNAEVLQSALNDRLKKDVRELLKAMDQGTSLGRDAGKLGAMLKAGEGMLEGEAIPAEYQAVFRQVLDGGVPIIDILSAVSKLGLNLSGMTQTDAIAAIRAAAPTDARLAGLVENRPLLNTLTALARRSAKEMALMQLRQLSNATEAAAIKKEMETLRTASKEQLDRMWADIQTLTDRTSLSVRLRMAMLKERRELNRITRSIKDGNEMLRVLEGVSGYVDDKVTELDKAVGNFSDWRPVPTFEGKVRNDPVWIAMRPKADGTWTAATRTLRFTDNDEVAEIEQVRTDLMHNKAWLRANADLKGTQTYERVQQQTRQIEMLDLERQSLAAHRVSIIDGLLPSVFKKFKDTGTSGGEQIARGGNAFMNIMRQHGAEVDGLSQDWTKAFKDLYAQAGEGFRDWNDFYDRVVVPAIYRIESEIGRDEQGALREARKTARANTPAPLDGFDAALNKLMQRTKTASEYMLKIAEDNGVFIADPRLNGQLRKAIAYGWMTAPRSLNHSVVTTLMKDMEKQGWTVDWNVETKQNREGNPIESRSVDGAATFAAVDTEAADLGSQIGRFFSADIVERFLTPFIRKPGKAVFYTPDGNGINSLVVESAWNDAGGDVAKWIDLLGERSGALETLAGEQRQEGDTATPLGKWRRSMLDRIDSRWAMEMRIVHNTGGASNVMSNDRPVMHALMDARLNDDIPPEHLTYMKFDGVSSQTRLGQIAYHASFGRDGAAMDNAVQSALSEVQNRIDVRKEIWNQTTSKAERTRLAKEAGYDYNTLDRSLEDYKRVISWSGELRGLFSPGGRSGVMSDISAGVETMRMLQVMMLNQPTSGLMNAASLLDFPLNYKSFGRFATRATMTAMGQFVQRTFGSFAQDIANRNLFDVEYLDVIGPMSDKRSANNREWSTKLADIGAQGSYANPVTLREKASVGVKKATRFGMNLVEKGLTPGDVLLRKGTTAKGSESRFTLLTSPFKFLNEAIMQSVALTNVRMFEVVMKRAMDFAVANPGILDDPNYILTPADLKMDGRGLFGDAKALEWMKQNAANYGLGSMEDMARGAITNKAAGERIFNRDQAIKLAIMAMDQISGEGGITTRSSESYTNPLARLAMPMLGWATWRSQKVAEAFKESDGTSTKQSFVSGLKTMALVSLPLAYLFSLGMEEWDEWARGKKSQSGAPNTMLGVTQRLARVGSLGIVGDLGFGAFTPLDPASGQRQFTLDSKIFAYNTIANIAAGIRDISIQGVDNTTWASGARNLTMSLGGNGPIQYIQILNNLGFEVSEAEARVLKRQNVYAVVRAAAVTAGVPVRKAGGSSTPSARGTWVREMQMAAFAGDRVAFRDAYMSAIAAAREAGEDDPQAVVRRDWNYRSPFRVLANDRPTDEELDKMQAAMDPEGRAIMQSAMRNYEAFTSFIEPTPAEKALAKAQASVRRALDPEARIEARRRAMELR